MKCVGKTFDDIGLTVKFATFGTWDLNRISHLINLFNVELFSKDLLR